MGSWMLGKITVVLELHAEEDYFCPVAAWYHKYFSGYVWYQIKDSDDTVLCGFIPRTLMPLCSVVSLVALHVDYYCNEETFTIR